MITIDLYKGDVASFRCYSIFFDPVWCSSFVVALEMESAIFFLHLSLLSNLVLVVGLKNQLSPSLNYRFFPSWSLGSACFSLQIMDCVADHTAATGTRSKIWVAGIILGLNSINKLAS